MQQSKQQLVDYKEAQTNSGKKTITYAKNLMNGWELPTGDLLKINQDAILNKSLRNVGIDIIIRDGDGNVLTTKRMQRDFFVNSLLVEAFGTPQVTIFSSELGLKMIFLERDSLQVINSIKQRDSHCNSIGLIITI